MEYVNVLIVDMANVLLKAWQVVSHLKIRFINKLL